MCLTFSLNEVLFEEVCELEGRSDVDVKCLVKLLQRDIFNGVWDNYARIVHLQKKRHIQKQ